MGKHKTINEKIEILKAAKELGFTSASRIYGVNQTVIRRWKERYEKFGKEGLKKIGYNKPIKVLTLEEENKKLKELLADKEIELQIKNELLKKTLRRIRTEES